MTSYQRVNAILVLTITVMLIAACGRNSPTPTPIPTIDVGSAIQATVQQVRAERETAGAESGATSTIEAAAAATEVAAATATTDARIANLTATSETILQSITATAETTRIAAVTATATAESIDIALIRNWNDRSGTPAAIAASPDGSLIASADDETSDIYIRLVTDGSIVRSLSAASSIGSANVLAWSPSGDRLAVGYRRGAIIWNPLTGDRVTDLSNTVYAITALAWNRDGSRLVVGTEGKYVILYNTDQPDPIAGYEEDQTTSLLWSPDNAQLLTTSGWLVTAWRVSDGSKLAQYNFVNEEEQRSYTATDMAWSRDGIFIAMSGEQEAALVDPATWKLRMLPRGPDPRFSTGIAISPDGSLVTDGVRIWNTTNGELVRTIPHPEDIPVAHVVWALPGNLIAIAYEHGSVALYSVQVHR